MALFVRWALLPVLLLPAWAGATVALSQTLEEMAWGSPRVVRAVAGPSVARWDPAHRRIFTYTSLQVSEVLKGLRETAVQVRSPGGEVGPVGQRVEGAPRFAPGEQVVVFLEPAPDEAGVWQVSALAAGKVTLARSPQGEERATRDLRGLMRYALGAIDRAPVHQTGPIEDLGASAAFLARVRAAVRGAR